MGGVGWLAEEEEEEEDEEEEGEENPCCKDGSIELLEEEDA